MKNSFKLTTNEGKTIKVSHDTYKNAKNMYQNGYWSTIVYDLLGNIHSVLLGENFR